MTIEEALEPLRRYSISIAFEQELAKAKAQLQAYVDAELMKLKVKHAAELSILDQEIMSLKATLKKEKTK